ncbi:MAG: Nif3-like dinuclear metal center hexameric protein, partial [Prolixibacteraceae bacterium]|nr:Nif3-like dinuclear metal center hexameric protein [Prolixibacteraceae bacterium]
MQIKEITNYIESIAPLSYQESYDNAGLIVGNGSDETNGALITLDVTEPVIDEAIRLKFKLIIAHHPLIFNGIKKINSSTEIGRCLIKAVKNNIAVYAAHTNLDNVKRGVNGKICTKIGLTNCRMLKPFNDKLRKLVVYTPEAYASQVQESIFNAGGGCIGNYDSCGYSLKGKGTFRGNENTHPFVGEKGKLHTEKEIRLETIIPEVIKDKVINAM